MWGEEKKGGRTSIVGDVSHGETTLGVSDEERGALGTSVAAFMPNGGRYRFCPWLWFRVMEVSRVSVQPITILFLIALHTGLLSNFLMRTFILFLFRSAELFSGLPEQIMPKLCACLCGVSFCGPSSLVVVVVVANGF